MKARLIAGLIALALSGCVPSQGGEPPCTEQDCQPQPDPALN